MKGGKACEVGGPGYIVEYHVHYGVVKQNTIIPSIQLNADTLLLRSADALFFLIIPTALQAWKTRD